MQQSITYITLAPEEYKKQLEEAATLAIQKYREAIAERPVPKEKIMQLYDWGIKKFYNERRKRKVEAVEQYGNVPFYLPSQFVSNQLGSPK